MEATRKQLTLFDPPAPAAPAPAPRDPHVAAADTKRLTGQNAVILHLLQQGPCTNVELAKVSLKYTSRLSDLRAAGYTVVCERGQGGLNTYWLRQ